MTTTGPRRPGDRDLLPTRRQAGGRSTRAGAVVRRSLCLALVVIGVVAVFLGRPKPHAPAGPALTTQAGTALWSTRRTPQVIADAVSAQQLDRDVASALQGTSNACTVVEAPGLGRVAATQPDKPLTGASTEKILTATAALAVLGPDYRYQTKLTAPSKPQNGSLDRAWLVGGGDPLLHTPEYQATLEDAALTKNNASTPMATFADSITATGVKNIGTLFVDDARYDNVRYLPTWRANYKTEGQVGSLGALIVNSGFSSFDGTRVPAEDPALDAGTQLAALLKARGVTVGNIQRGAQPPATAELASITSPTMRDILGEMLRASDNTTAELVTREMAVKSGRVGSTQAGAQTILATLGTLGIPTQGLQILDGSGLSRDNTLTCNALIAAIDRGETGTARLNDLLAVAGTSGTLANRFQGTALQGRMYAKTGSLNGVTGLTGYVDVNRPLSFAFVANGSFPDVSAVSLQTRVATIIGRYPAGPAATALVPAVASPCAISACR